MIRPGDFVKDTITGLTGIVICRAEWQHGCVRMTIQPREHKDGKPADPFVIDEAGCELIEAQAVASHQEDEPRKHGDRPDARHVPNASR